MKHKFLGSIVAAAVIATSLSAENTLMERFDKMEKEMAALKAELNALKSENNKLSDQLKANDSKTATTVAAAGATKEDIADIKDHLAEINKKTNGNNIKWSADFRTSVDNLNYKMADGSTIKNNAVLSNRLWLGMSYAANENLSFTGQLAYNKLFGERSMSPEDIMNADGFDWVSGESAYDDTLRVRSAYFFYQDDEFLGAEIPWTISIGRRPSTQGHLINFRDNDPASSPLAHTVNVEFDGASAKFGMEELTGLDGSYFKLCAGRGMTDAEPRFSSTPYSSSHAKTSNVDMAGIIVVPYDDKQYSTGFQYTYANNLIDMVNPMDMMQGMETVGGLHTATGFVMVNGIGEGISDFLDDSMIFVSGAMSKTDPYPGKQGMLGSTESKTGYSYWIGTQFPSLISDEGRWGIEFNHGSNYWRPITYSEDTLVGSKLAARGDAYEIYMTEPLVDDILTFQLRYTYIDYDYSGSNGFFGSNTGTPMSIEQVQAMGTPWSSMIVDKAQDIRAYIRYRF